MVSLRSVKRLFTHEATVTGQRQVGTEDDGFGGTQPTTESVSLSIDGRFESDGRVLTRQFRGLDEMDGPLFVCFGDGLAEWDDAPEGYEEETAAPYVIQTDDTVTFASMTGEFEIREIEPLHLDSSMPELVVINPVEVG